MDKLQGESGSISSVILECEVVEVLAEIQVIAVDNISDNATISPEKAIPEILVTEPLAPLLSHLLKYGVLIASSVVLLGSILYLIHHGFEPAEYDVFRGEPLELRSLNGVVTAVLSGSYRGIVQLGLLLLVATPIIRVAVSLFTFLRLRDWNYVVLTFLVLSALIYSFLPAIL
jgi:uncharacterized membrane protein